MHNNHYEQTGRRIIEEIGKNEPMGIGLNELTRTVKVTKNKATVLNYVNYLKRLDLVKINSMGLYCLTSSSIRKHEREKLIPLIQYYLKIGKRNERQHVIREYTKKKERIILAILRNATTGGGISKHRSLMNGEVWPVIELPSENSYELYDLEEDRRIMECCFDYLTSNRLSILTPFYSSELREVCLKIDDPHVGQFIIFMEQLLSSLIKRMQLDWFHRKPTSEEVDWTDFLYPKEMSNNAFSYFYETKGQGKSKDIDHDHESRIKGYDYLVKQTWNDVRRNFSSIESKHPEIYNLIIRRIYPAHMQDCVNKSIDEGIKKGTPAVVSLVRITTSPQPPSKRETYDYALPISIRTEIADRL